MRRAVEELVQACRELGHAIIRAVPRTPTPWRQHYAARLFTTYTRRKGDLR